MKTINDIKKKILNTLENVGRTEYFSVYSTTGKLIKIRVGDHSGNKRNNGEAKTLSFISNRTKQKVSAYNSMIEEWEVDMDTKLTDTFQTIGHDEQIQELLDKGISKSAIGRIIGVHRLTVADFINRQKLIIKQ